MKNIQTLALIAISPLSVFAHTYNSDEKQPNVIFIYADDMGRGMLSHFGQKIISTPNIDRIFSEGTSFEYAYGCMFSAPARASMLTGYNDCHKGKWNIPKGGKLDKATTLARLDSIEQQVDKGRVKLPADDLCLPQVFKRAGYVTGEYGKLDWGFTTTRAQMREHGWDEYCGYLCHRRAHFFYPPFLFENDTIVFFSENTHPTGGRGFEIESPQNYKARWDMKGKVRYSQDIFLERMLNFIRKHKDEKFFLYHPTQLPHGPVAIPAVHPEVKNRSDLSEIEKEYASMVLKLDEHVGILLDELEKLGLLDNTIIVFSADNGHETYYTNGNRCRKGPNRDMNGKKYDAWNYPYRSETAGDRFDGNNGFSGKKWMNWEGSVRVPLVFRWKGHIPEGKVSEQVVSNYDLLPTFAQMLHVELTTPKDGESFLPVLTGDQKDLGHERFVFLNSSEGPAVVSSKLWKLRYNKKRKEYRLHNLREDYREERIVNDKYPEIFRYMKEILKPYI